MNNLQHTITKVYQGNIKKYDAKLLKLSILLNRISFLRLSIFVISSITLIYLFSSNLLTPILIVFPLLIFCFGAAIKYYNKTAFLKKHTAFLKRINESEILREEYNLEEFDTGHKFINQNHPYTSDLDIFGQHSVFQLLNRTTTESGMILLSEWLSEPAPNDEIHDRQKAIKELAQKLDWRQDFQASGMHFQNKKSDYYKLLDWVEKPVVLLKYRQIYIAAATILSVLSFLALYFYIPYFNSPSWFIYLLPFITVYFIINRILKKLKPIADDIVKTSQENINTLRGYRTLINKIENESFKSKKLCQLQSILIKNKQSASKEINMLCRLLEFSQQRGVKIKYISIGGNPTYFLLNSFLLIDIYLIVGIERWKSKNKVFLKPWSEVVSEFEAITSLAGFCYSNPSYTFPQLEEKNNFIHFESLGHPLLNSKKRVCNNFYSEGYGDVVLITGSNMGGKSTFFLLDEMFKGTNSEDRHKGGFSLINQLSKLKTSGIIATHDIELAKLSGNKRLVANYSFNSEIKDNSMIFSYKLLSGICNDFNASELMKKSGIKILSNISDERN